MKRLLILTLLMMPFLRMAAQPSDVQRKLIERKYGMFIHFGPNTFQDIEWGDGQVSPSVYNPEHLDCDQWVRVARDAGFRYVLLVTKHHDGFCLWDSKYTDYDVASSPVKTDVVKAVSDACRKYGLQFAVYYSLWDRHEPSYKSKKFGRYIDYMEKQLTELLTNYGDICELWFDGGWDRNVDDWQIERIYKHIRKLQPDCAVGVNLTLTADEHKKEYTWDDLILPDSCDRDNKYYLKYFPSDFRLWDPKISPVYDCKQYLYGGKSYYMPFEHTICLSKAWNWFQRAQPMPVRDIDELEELFYWTTSNDNTLVVNVGPNREGRIYEHEANALLALAQRLGIGHGKPLPSRPGKIVSYRAEAAATSVWGGDAGYEAWRAVDGGMQTRWASETLNPVLTLSFSQPKSFNKIVMFEYQEQTTGDDGFSNQRVGRIRSYTIDVMQDGRWVTVYVGNESLGDCKVIRLPRRYTSQQVRLNVLSASAPPSIWEFELIDEP